MNRSRHDRLSRHAGVRCNPLALVMPAPQSSFRRRPESRGAVGGKTAASLGTKACPGLRSGIRGTSQTDESRSFRSSTICYPCARSVPAISLSPWERAGVRVKAGIGARGTNHTQTPPPTGPPFVIPAKSLPRTPIRGRNPEGRWEARPPPVLIRKQVPDPEPGYVAPVKLMSPGRSDLLPSVTQCARSVPAISLSPWERAGVRVKAGIGARGTNHTQTPPPTGPRTRHAGPPNRHSGEGRNPEGRWEARPPPVLPRIPDSDPGYVAPVKLMSPGRSDLLPSVTHVPGLYRRSPSPLGRGLG